MIKKKIIDLHTHSTASDGSCTPSEIMKMASDAALAGVALTDHDTVSGLEEFISAADAPGMPEAVPGVEISVEFEGREVHIVGLFIDYEYAPLTELLCEIRNHRNERNEKIVAKLQELGYDVTLGELLDAAGGESVGRPLLAKILIEKNYFSEIQEVFDKVLKRGAPAYFPRVLPDPERAISIIHEAGGVAVWAHPLYRAVNGRSYLRKVLKTLVACGVDGVEAYYSTFSPEQMKSVLDIAGEFSLAVSGGSDFHGKNIEGITLGTGYGGLEVPYELLERLREIADKRKSS